MSDVVKALENIKKSLDKLNNEVYFRRAILYSLRYIVRQFAKEDDNAEIPIELQSERIWGEI